MVKISKKGRGAAGGSGRGGRGAGRGAGRGSGRGASNGRGGGGGRGPKTLNTSKGTFVFQRVTDGLYIEHQWGKNSGHIGIAQESLASFVRTLTELATSSGAVRCSVPTTLAVTTTLSTVLPDPIAANSIATILATITRRGRPVATTPVATAVATATVTTRCVGVPPVPTDRLRCR